METIQTEQKVLSNEDTYHRFETDRLAFDEFNNFQGNRDNSQLWRLGKITIGISYYKNPQLVDNIQNIINELNQFDLIQEIILINDSPGDAKLKLRLTEIEKFEKVKIINNVENYGYTKSINQAYSIAKMNGTHLMCINSDVIFNIDIVNEVAAVSCLDHQIGFVFPRADSDPFFGMTGILAESEFIRKKLLPRFQFTPTAVGYFLFVNARVLERFDGFDELFSPGYEEENDFILRAGALGFRAVMANHALVQHATSSSFSESSTELKSKHYKMLVEKHSFYPTLISNYGESAAQSLYRVFNSLHSSNDLLVDCYGFLPTLNGTTIYARDLIEALNRSNKFEEKIITILIREDVYILLEFYRLTRLRFCFDVSTLRPHFNLLQIAQPFDPEVLKRALKYSVCSVVIFFDTIAQDVVSLRSERTENIWTDLTLVYSSVVFISNASLNAFSARYPKRNSDFHVIYPSLSVNDYGPSLKITKSNKSENILVVGNKFPHKDIDHTIEKIIENKSLENIKFDVLTDSPLLDTSRIFVHKSGSLSQNSITNLYSSCRVVLYPSYYEGFGLPLMEALHFKKPIFVRDAPLYEELKNQLGSISKNIYCYKTNEDLMALLSFPPEWKEEKTDNLLNWDFVSSKIFAVIDNNISKFDFSDRALAIRQLHRTATENSSHSHPLLTSIFIKANKLRERFPFSYKVARYFYHRLFR